MDTHIHDSNFIMTNVKPEPAEFVSLFPCYGNSHDKMDNKNEGFASAVLIKEKECVSVPMMDIKLDISIPGITCNDDVKLNLNNENNLLNSSCTSNGRESEVSIRNFQRKCVHTDERNNDCEICTKSLKTNQNFSRHMKLHTGKRNYKCEFCTNSYLRKLHLSLHTKVHDVKKNHKCAICTKSFAIKSHLSRHMKTHERNYKCEICMKQFLTKRQLSKHEKKNTCEKNHKCEICKKCFTRKQNLLAHLKIHKGERNYTCELCSKCFVRRDGLSRHIKTHGGDRNYKCEICTNRYTTKHNLLKHMKGHTGKSEAFLEHKETESGKNVEEKPLRKFASKIVDKIEMGLVKEEVGDCMKIEKLEVKNDKMENFTHDSNFSTEVKVEPAEFATLSPTPQSCYGYSPIEMDEKNADSAVLIKKDECVSVPTAEIKLDISNPCNDNKIKLNSSSTNKEIKERAYNCEICTKSFTLKSHLSDHSKMHTGERNYKCEICDKHFGRKFNMLIHTKIHTGERHYKCEICTKSFIIKSHLSDHMKMHTGERNYKCEICNGCFRRKFNLSIHMKIHGDERNYKCDICTKSFKTKQNLSYHVKTHGGKSNCKCGICMKSFVKKSHLSDHMKIHTGERNYKCRVCTKCFVTKQQLLSHVKIHTTEKNHKCDVCAKCFSRKQNLLNHVKIHTDERNYECEICTKRFIRNVDLLKHEETHAIVMHTQKNNVCLEYKKTQTGNRLEDSLPSKIQNIEKIETVLVKEEAAMFMKIERLEMSNDKEPSTATIMEDKSKSTEFFGLWQTINSEIIIKEEEDTMATT